MLLAMGSKLMGVVMLHLLLKAFQIVPSDALAVSKTDKGQSKLKGPGAKSKAAPLSTGGI